MRTAAILPVKRFTRAKSRLGAGGVDQSMRERLAHAMVRDVLSALGRTSGVERIIVVTSEQALSDVVQRSGNMLLDDTAEQGQSAAVALGVRRAVEEGYQRVLCVPGDCPALDAAELDALLRDTPPVRDDADRDRAQVVIVPDRHGTGTNGLLLTPPDILQPAFGPGSCERHRALAEAAGATCRLARPASLLLDIDTGADLAELRRRLSNTDAPATNTRAVLGRQDSGSVGLSTLAEAG